VCSAAERAAEAAAAAEAEVPPARVRRKHHYRSVSFKSGNDLSVVQYFDGEAPLPGFVMANHGSGVADDAWKRHAAFASAAREEHQSERFAMHELSPNGVPYFCT
jgi:hypothetical protein